MCCVKEVLFQGRGLQQGGKCRTSHTQDSHTVSSISLWRRAVQQLGTLLKVYTKALELQKPQRAKEDMPTCTVCPQCHR